MGMSIERDEIEKFFEFGVAARCFHEIWGRIDQEKIFLIGEFVRGLFFSSLFSLLT